MLFFPHACKFVQIVYMCECWVNDWCISSRTHWLLRPACNWLCATGSYCLYSVSLHPSIDTCQSEILFTSLPSPVLFSSLGLIIFMPVSAAWGHKLSVCFRRLLLCKLSSVISALAQLMTWERAIWGCWMSPYQQTTDIDIDYQMSGVHYWDRDWTNNCCRLDRNLTWLFAVLKPERHCFVFLFMSPDWY